MMFPTFCSTGYTVGSGSIEKLRDYRQDKIALVVDNTIISALSLDKLLYEDILEGCSFKVVCNIQREPTIQMLKEPISSIHEFGPTRIVGIGGGAVMDAAKALWLFYELPHYTWDQAFVMFGVESFPGKAKLTLIPTTSGTGSDTTGCSVVKDAENRKRLILTNEIVPTEAILDFNLLRSLPLKNIAYSGTDALAHALESAICLRGNRMIQAVSCQAAVTIIKNLGASYRGDSEAREKIHVAASLAGLGISNSGTGMAHGMDQAGGDFHLPHGLVTGLLLPYTMRYLMPQPFYVEVAEQLGFDGSDTEKQNKLIDSIFELYEEIGMPKTLKDVGVPENEYLANIPLYIERAIADDNIIVCPENPTREELDGLYMQFYYGIELNSKQEE